MAKHSCSELLLAVVFAFAFPVKNVDGQSQDAIGIEIIVGKDDSGTPIINRNGEFQILIKNQSDKPVNLWRENCQPGYENLTFNIDDGEGQSSEMRKRTPYPSNWRNKPPKTTSISPGYSFSLKVLPSSIWGEREWMGVPEPNTDKLVTLSAVFEIAAAENTIANGVWTGRVTSAPIKVKVVDASLRTPFDYLNADCPKQALRQIAADHTWINRTDNYSQTPLHIASQQGFVEVARWLLSHGADANAKAYNSFTPLLFANDPAMVQLLLDNHADTSARDVSGRTKLQEITEQFARSEGDPFYGIEAENAQAMIKMLRNAGAEYDVLSACFLDDVDGVRTLITDNPTSNDADLIRHAAEFGRTRIVKLLLEHGADPNGTVYGGLPISDFALKHSDVLELLLNAGADPKVSIDYKGNGVGPEGSTLLHEAIESKCTESVKLLLEKGLEVNQPAANGWMPLHLASSRGNANIVELLLQSKADLNVLTKDGWTPMNLAADEVRPDQEEDNAEFQSVIRMLERAGAKVDIFAAIACDDVRRVTEILKSDPSIGEAKNPGGLPALHQAVTLDRREIAKLLLDNGTNPDVRSVDKGRGTGNETALFEAAFWGRVEIAELLIERGADVNAKAERGVTPLHEAARMRNIEIVRLLLTHGADVNAKDEKGSTPLAWAGLYGESPEMSQLLKQHGGK